MLTALIAVSILGVDPPPLIPAPAWLMMGPHPLRRDPEPVPVIRRTTRGPAEGYTLTIDGNGILIIASDDAGAFYAARTLEQLPRPLPELTLTDAPRFAWRGLHLDVARHFFPVADVKRLLELMALWKLNVFHWHLTDDQGWRLPVAKHPELTSTGPAYTAAEIRDVVAFAAARHITVVPEIDLPGHSRAVLAVHPELSCRGKPLPLPTTYGVFEDVLCIGNPATYALVDDVLEATAALFPGPYLHLGGDEVPTTRWRECPRCKALHQADFLKRALATVRRLGKRPIGWDEVLEQDPPKDMIIMRWRDTRAVPGHDFVLNPMSVTYLSDPSIRWEQIAALDVPAGALGVEASLWSEDLRTMADLEPLLFPRLLALADLAWAQGPSPLGPRLAAARARLDALKVAYDIEAPHGLEPQRAFVDGGTVTLSPPEMFPGAEILYATDGGAPSLRYERPLTLAKTTDVTAQLRLGDRLGHLARGHYVVEPPRAPAKDCPAASFLYYEDGLLRRKGALTTLIPVSVRPHDWSLHVTGGFRAPAAGIYRFDLTSDDGSQLFVGERLLIDNGGDHAPRLRSGEVALEAGCHALRLEMTQHGGGYALSLDVSRAGEKPHPVF